MCGAAARYAALHCAAARCELDRRIRRPDKPEDWAFLREFSAYHNVELGRDYPPILITSSVKDDRVHPGHARKMAAKLAGYGYPVMFYEPAQGGHAGATDNAQAAQLTALRFAFQRKTIAPEMTSSS